MEKPIAHYCHQHNIRATRLLGSGKDGVVYETTRLSALKSHVRAEGYGKERDAYLRLRDCQITQVLGLRVPSLWNFSDEDQIVEMSIVQPPFIVDFASAWLDQPPDFSDDVIDDWHREIRDRFGDRAADVMAVLDTLARTADVYLLDVHPHNIKFE